MVLTAISTALGSLVAAKDIAQTMVGLHDAAILNGKIAELNSKIIDAQSGIFLVNEERSALIERVGFLEKEIADYETWETEKQEYILKEVDSGAFAFVLKPEAGGTEPPHWLCTTCYGNRKKAFLQDDGQAAQSGNDFRKRVYRCFSCKSQIRVQYHITPSKPAEVR